jgi:small subunit ribosomal protein S20
VSLAVASPSPWWPPSARCRPGPAPNPRARPSIRPRDTAHPPPPAPAAPARTAVVAAAAFRVVEAKQNSLKRQRTAEKARLRNKSKRSEVATRIKKVFAALEPFKAAPPATEADLAPVGLLMAEAYSVIDKAVKTNVLHANTAARRKSRLARARKFVLAAAGLVPPEAM